MMSFRVFAAGLLTVIAYQIAVAAFVVFFMLHCGCAEAHGQYGADTAGAVAWRAGE